MKTKLKYTHCRDIMTKNIFKSWVKKWFKDVRFEGNEYGNWYPVISISNWDDVKDQLPENHKPIDIINYKQEKS